MTYILYIFSKYYGYYVLWIFPSEYTGGILLMENVTILGNIGEKCCYIPAKIMNFLAKITYFLAKITYFLGKITSFPTKMIYFHTKMIYFISKIVQFHIRTSVFLFLTLPFFTHDARWL